MTKETELIKNKIDIVDFLRSYIQLSPAGKNFKALCPFHGEKTPSFIVSKERQIWHCFGCGEGGDVFKFVMKYENIEFSEALRFLAEKAGVPIKSLGAAEQREFGVLIDIHSEATNFFQNTLEKNIKAAEYLNKRGLTKETIREFEIGFAPGGEYLTLYLIQQGFDVNDIVRAGIAYKNANGLYRDRFDQRIIFPIHNNIGKVVAFTGRLIAEKDDSPKYMNSPETPIFNKSKILYGLHKSKHFITESHTAFLVEGQMDFLMSWQSGVKNVIAVSGTGLTEHHLEKLRRLADNIIVSFDNDEAGVKALERGLDLFNKFDFHIKTIELGKYKDPAEACENDSAFLSEAIKKAVPAFSRILNYYFKSETLESRDVALQKRILRHILSKISKIRSPIEQNAWLKALSQKSGIGENTLIDEMDVFSSQDEQGKEKTTETSQKYEYEKPVSRWELVSERLISIAFTNEEFWDIIKKNKDYLPKSHQTFLDNPDREKAPIFEMRSSYEFSELKPNEIKKEFGDLLTQVKLESLKIQQAILKTEIQKAENEENEQKLGEVIDSFNKISKQIQELKK